MTLFKLSVLRWLVLVTSLVLLLNSGHVSGKVFTRCQLAKELLRQGFPKEDLREWVCLVEEVSERNTHHIDGSYKDDSEDLGLFQINTHFCRSMRRGGECNITCDDLLSNDITKASRCAMYIYDTYYGFEPWDKFFEKCIYYVPNLQSCGIRY